MMALPRTPLEAFEQDEDLEASDIVDVSQLPPG